MAAWWHKKKGPPTEQRLTDYCIVAAIRFAQPQARATKIVLGHKDHQELSRRRSEFIAIALLFTLTLSSLNADLLIILLKGCQVLTCLRELSFFHPFADIPVHEGTFGVHEVELVVDAREDLCDGRGVADHADSTHYLGEVATRNHSWRLVVDATLEARRRPIHKLDRTLSLN